MMLSTQEAQKIAAEKAVAVLGIENIAKYDRWTESKEGAIVLAMGERTPTKSVIPSFDNSIPWELVHYFRVDLNTGEVNVSKRTNVTIFD